MLTLWSLYSDFTPSSNYPLSLYFLFFIYWSLLTLITILSNFSILLSLTTWRCNLFTLKTKNLASSHVHYKLNTYCTTQQRREIFNTGTGGTSHSANRDTRLNLRTILLMENPLQLPMMPWKGRAHPLDLKPTSGFPMNPRTCTREAQLSARLLLCLTPTRTRWVVANLIKIRELLSLVLTNGTRLLVNVCQILKRLTEVNIRVVAAGTTEDLKGLCTLTVQTGVRYLTMLMVKSIHSLNLTWISAAQRCNYVRCKISSNRAWWRWTRTGSRWHIQVAPCLDVTTFSCSAHSGQLCSITLTFSRAWEMCTF